MYAWYFPKGFQGDFSSRRHDWASAVVWIDNPALDAPKLLGVSTSTSDSNLIWNGPVLDGGFQDLIMWEQLTDAARVALNTVDFGNAKVMFNGANFADKLDNAWPF
ncbi:hypothetical protein JM18_006919 [Phytophthora kernoviae]|uniref:Uncharacterized protein n=1 Tax=Phytophthora kernoviae TaxID=325452 RepID=A0A8T0LQY8_9STRA|nr:hypothetical protein JM16_007060 [Phytophthora kernoviae]KAG2520582.1 hypothetical protein JM18_006919 [Phytophthora kernoviae]